ncbi:hypothetical protein CDD83_2047 [Cordyceps sp. RAO-2017]|nr:hypothetical protein CDD83_2047 [Cordyceps sp. RAO-2017]
MPFHLSSSGHASGTDPSVAEAAVGVSTPLLGAGHSPPSLVPGPSEAATRPDPDAGQDADGDRAAERNGIPALADKMHLILPAVGIGLFLAAFDQTVTMASYARLGSDLDALNSVSWVTTSYGPRSLSDAACAL